MPRYDVAVVVHEGLVSIHHSSCDLLKSIIINYDALEYTPTAEMEPSIVEWLREHDSIYWAYRLHEEAEERHNKEIDSEWQEFLEWKANRKIMVEG